jgi:hypothetical protein
MSLLDILLHLLNFSAPALVLALLLPLIARFFIKKQAPALAWWSQAAINFIVGVAALLAGLWLWSRDGKMAAYALLVLALATSQWLLSRGWRK